MLDFPRARKIIESRLKELQLPDHPAGLYDPIRYILSIGGKRFRPALVLIANDLFLGRQEDALHPALALEIFHNFTLLHDDIMDNAPVRRNHPTVHTKWDSNVAILSGDVMSILSFRYLSMTRKEIVPGLLEIFTATAIEVCEGQQLDMNFEKRESVSMDEYMRMIRLKTAALIAACLKIGAVTAGAPKEDTDNLYRFGLNLGLAFQLMDDYLDLYGDMEKFGKKPGGDILADKKTFMMIRALETAGTGDRELLTGRAPGIYPGPEEKVKTVRQVFDRLGVGKQTLEEAEKYFTLATGYLDQLSVPPRKSRILLELAQSLMKRDS